MKSEENKMKVAIIAPQGLPVPPVKGGAIETLIDIVLKENEKHHQLDIDVYTVYDQEAIKESKNYSNVNFIFLLKNKRYIKLRNKFISLCRKVFKMKMRYTYPYEICKHMNDKNYDKVIIEGDSSLIIPVANVVGKEKVFFHIHHNPLSTNHDEFRNELQHCHEVIAVSDYIKEGIFTCIGNRTFNCVTLRNCYRLNEEKEKKHQYSRQHLGIAEDDIVIVFSGRPIPDKGVKELLLAFQLLAESHDDIKLLIVGNSGFGNQVMTEYEEDLRKIAKGLDDKVLFTGFVPHHQILEVYRLADIGVVPSIYDDPAPLVVIECMAAGLPLIVTDSGGIPEYVADECAIIIKREDDIVNGLKESLITLIENQELRETMSRNALTHSQQFTEEKFYQEFVRLLKCSRITGGQ